MYLSWQKPLSRTAPAARQMGKNAGASGLVHLDESSSEGLAPALAKQQK
jgi:hypothetical protein